MNPIEVIIPLPSERQQFSKELYDKDPSAWKVEDRNGNPVRVLCTDAKLHNYPVVSLNTHGRAINHMPSGRVSISNDSNDLFMRPVSGGLERDGWMNVYNDDGWPSKDIADAKSVEDRIALIHLKFRNV